MKLPQVKSHSVTAIGGEGHTRKSHVQDSENLSTADS